MFKAENGKYTIIPVEALSVVIEHKEDGTLRHIGIPEDMTLETSLNAVRLKIHETATSQEKSIDTVIRQWKKFQASKEFMEQDEREYFERIWSGFDMEKYLKTREDVSKDLRRSVFELTDLMLEHNIPIHKIDTDENEGGVVQVSLDQVNNLLDGLGKKS